MAILTAEQVRASLGSMFADRADINLLLAAVTSTIETYCDRSFDQAAVTEKVDGTGTSWLPVRRPPVASVTSVKVNGDAIDDYVVGTYALFRGDGTEDPREAAVWPTGRQNVEVIYTGGYVSIPEEVTYAALILVRHFTQAARTPGLLRREKIGDYEYELSTMALDQNQLPAVVRALLDPYRRVLL